MTFWVCTAKVFFDVFRLVLVFDVTASDIYVIYIIGYKLVIILFIKLGEYFDMVLTYVLPASLEGSTDIIAKP